MGHEIEYHDAMMKMLELIWGKGFMAPGGTGTVDRMVNGLDLQGKRVLDIGCGLGGPDFHLAEKYDAHTTGIDLEPHLIESAQEKAKEKGLRSQCEFILVEPGPLPFPDRHFDLIISSGAFTQIADKRDLLADCFRVLRPGGMVSSYEWTTTQDTISEDMKYFFKMEGLTYALETPETYRELYQSAGFAHVSLSDGSDWYRRRSREEYELIKGDMYPQLVESIGQKDADHFVGNWLAMVIVCEKGELTQTYFRATLTDQESNATSSKSNTKTTRLKKHPHHRVHRLRKPLDCN
jgi:ubiquinone/menaquinone biosynthesis C-methylase UbiE